jgi:hypothetical protein
MASDDLLTITQKIVKRLPLSVVPTSVIGSSDPQTMQLLALIQEAGDELMSVHPWQVLNTDFLWTITANPNTVDFPDDWNRWLVDSAVWNNAYLLSPLNGPMTSDQWHLLLQMPGVFFPGYWRYNDDQLLTYGLNIGSQCYTQYVSRNWILQDDGTAIPEFDADTNTIKLRERLLILSTIWRWKQSKGIDYAEDMRTYERELERDIAADRRPSQLSTRRFYNSTNVLSGLYAWPGRVIAP